MRCLRELKGKVWTSLNVPFNGMTPPKCVLHAKSCSVLDVKLEINSCADWANLTALSAQDDQAAMAK